MHLKIKLHSIFQTIKREITYIKNLINMNWSIVTWVLMQKNLGLVEIYTICFNFQFNSFSFYKCKERRDNPKLQMKTNLFKGEEI